MHPAAFFFPSGKLVNSQVWFFLNAFSSSLIAAHHLGSQQIPNRKVTRLHTEHSCQSRSLKPYLCMDLLVAALVPFLSAIGKCTDFPVSFEFSSSGVLDEQSLEDCSSCCIFGSSCTRLLSSPYSTFSPCSTFSRWSTLKVAVLGHVVVQLCGHHWLQKLK
jgi:hypothetical protein